MKKTLLLLAACLALIQVKAQITLDQVYPNASQKLYMVNLEVSGMKYVVKSDVQNNRFIKLYNLNHSLWKTINCNAMPTATYTFGGGTANTQYNFDAICISEKVFDCDDDIEFMYVSAYANISCFTGIYKENGTALLVADSMAPFVKINVPNQFKPLYNTPSGAKLILSHINGDAKVYSLPCVISNTVTLLEKNALKDQEHVLSAYPNPSYYQTTVEYKLPAGTTKAEIVISDLSGREIKRYTVDDSFSNILIPQHEMAAGTYIYSLVSEGKAISSKKIILAH